MNVHRPIACYAGRTRDVSVLMSSSSGGIFTELARVVFAMGGVVIGAKWTRDEKGFRVIHSVAENEEELALMRGSKYVVSDMSVAWKALRINLTAGRMVMFTGTPCQTAAIRQKYGECENLLLVSLICHASIATDVWQKWVQEVEQKAISRLVSVNMRDKKVGKWDFPKMSILFENPSKNYSCDFYRTPYGRAFRGIAVRACCCECLFRCGNSNSDIMIGDLWGVENAAPKYDDEKGVSAILVYTKLGATILARANLDSEEIAYEKILQGNPSLEKSPPTRPSQRAVFFRYLKTYDFARALRIAEIGRLNELKEFYYLAHPKFVNSIPMKIIRGLKKIVCMNARKTKVNKEIKEKIGIITISIKWLLLNYGTFFQHLALRRVITRLGYQPVRIAYDDELPSYIPSKSNLKGFLRVFWHWLRCGNSLENEWLEFSFNFFRIRQTKLEYEKLIGPINEKSEKQYASVIIGGDQILSSQDEKKWGSDFIAKTNTFSYSASADWLYAKNNPQRKKMIAVFLPRYSAVSLRENSGCEFVRQICPQLTPVKMPDPVFLLPKTEYEHIAGQRRIFNRPTLLAYVVNWYKEKDAYIDQLKELASQFNVRLKIIGSQGCEHFIPYKYVMNVGARGFLRAIRDAEYVVTNSFHGLVFSLIFNKKFLFVEQSLQPGRNQNERQKELLEEFNLSEKSVPSLDDIMAASNILSLDVPVSNINNKIANVKEMGLQFLYTSLKGKK